MVYFFNGGIIPKYMAIEDILPYSGPIYSCVIVDGANMIHKERDVFSVDRLGSVIKVIEKLGWPVHVGMKKGTFKYAMKNSSNLTSENKDLLNQLHDLGCITLINAPGVDKEKDDHEIIRTAIALNGWVVSNDKFRAHLKSLRDLKENDLATDIESRLVNVVFDWGDDKPIIKLPKNIEDESVTLIINSQSHTPGLSISSIKTKIRINTSEEIIYIPTAEPIGRDFILKYDIGKNNKKDATRISRSHFRFNIVNDEIYITDLGSMNGTSLNGMKIPSNIPKKWNKNMILKVGRFSLAYQE